MAAFGDTFARLARASILASGEALNETRMGDGIRLLERARVEGDLKKAVGGVATEAGVAVAAVDILLPQAELTEALERLDKRQDKALKAVRRQEMTVATFAMPSELPTAPSTSEQLNSLAVTFSRDKDISTRLRDLAFEISAWEALLKRCTTIIDGDPGLLRSFKRKKMLRVATTWGVLGAAALLLLSAGVAYLIRERKAQEEAALKAQQAALVLQARQRVDAALGVADPCVPVETSDGERPLLSDEQKKQIEGRQQRCDELKKKQQLEQQCASLVTHVASGALTAEDAQLAGAAEPALRRLTTRALTPADLDMPDGAMPCAGSEAEKKLWAQLAQGAAAGGPNLWGLAEGVSSKLAAQLVLPGVLPYPTVLAIAFRTEKIATAALKSGREPEVRKARSLCALKSSLGQALALSCQKISKM